MTAEKTEAIVLRVVEFSETSAIVTLMTETHGKIGALAKGARRKKSPFENALDLLAVCQVVFLERPNASLELLTEAKLERRFRGPQNGLPAVYGGYYVSELLQHLTQEHDSHPAAYRAAKSTLRLLESQTSAPEIPQIVLNFELAILRSVGHQPLLSHCVSCGESVNQVGRITFGLQAGGVLCTKCKIGQRNLVNLSEEAHQILIRKTEQIQADTEPREMLAPVAKMPELRKLMNRYISHVLGFPPRLHSFIN